MDYRHRPLRRGRRILAAGPLFFLFIVLGGLFGCAPVEKPAFEVEDTFLRGRALQTRTQGQAAYEEGDYRAALVRFREAYEIDSDLGDALGRVADLVGMGRAQTALGKVPEALRTLTSAVKLAFSTRDDQGLAGAYAALAEAFMSSKRFDLAIKNIEDALSLERAGGGARVRTLNLAAGIYLEAGRTDEAAMVVEKAIASQDQERPTPGLAASYRLMAKVFARRGETTTATAYYRKAYDVDESLGNVRSMALDLRGSAGLLAGAGWYDEAAGLFKKSYLLNRNAGLAEEAMSDLDKLVEVYHAMGDKKSERFYRAMKEAVRSDMR
jgi:tetratricopeptide (TPR) repeat protein